MDPHEDLGEAIRAFFTAAAEDIEQAGWASMCPVGAVGSEIADVEPDLRRACADIITSWVEQATEYFVGRCFAGHMTIRQVGARTPQEEEVLRGAERDPYRLAGSDIRWRSKDLHTGYYANGRLIASVGLVRAEVVVGDERFQVVGVGSVIVNHEFRRQGYLRPTLEAALERAATLGPERALLFCTPANAALYARFGFRELGADVTAAQPGGGRIVMPAPAMWRPLRAGVTWPAGPVRLPDLPF